jgi:DNA-binding NarL/FixJ family response regulator
MLMVIEVKALVTACAVFCRVIIFDLSKREENACPIRDTVANGLLSGNRPNDGKKTEEEQMITLAIMCTDEESEARLLNCLRGEKDLIVKRFIVIQNVVHDLDKGLAFINKMVGSPPDIIIVDGAILREAAALSLSPILEFTRKCDPMRAIIIGNRFIEENVIAMVKGGARGFLLRERLDADIVKCIRVVARGEMWLHADLIGRVFDELLRENHKKLRLKSPTDTQLAQMKTISQREMEVMALVSESMTNEEIAQKLFLSAKTVKTHLRNIFEKTGIRNRVEAVLLYIRYKQEVES